METKKQKIQRINDLLSGELPNIEYPLFWEKQGDYFIAGNYKLTVEQFEKLQKRKPCYVGWIEEKTY